MALVDTLAVRLGEMGMQTLTETLLKAEANAVVHIPFKTPQETLTEVQSEALFDRLAKRVSK